MNKMKIYEPAMCCETGLCGVGVNQELLRISTLTNTLKNKGIEIQRFNLNSAPNEFVTNQKVNNAIMEKGIECLPIVVVDDEIIITGRYPSNEEVLEIFSLKVIDLNMKKPGSVNLESCCCAKESESSSSLDGCCSNTKNCC